MVDSRFRFAGALLLISGASAADSLVGSQKMLCSASEVVVCGADGECAATAPWEMQMPQFLLLDLKAERLSTTAASGESRITEIRTQVRDNGQIIVQGLQQGRAFSLVISEDSGLASIAIALEDLAINVFGACTPTPVE